jgi:hypothetical protein
MSVIVVQVFVSLMLVAGSIVMFVFSARQKDFEQADRLALAPLEPDSGRQAVASPVPPLPEEKECTPNASNTTTP